jgi:hypothetical protein
MVMYDVPNNRLLPVQFSFLHQKSRGKVQSAPGVPERAGRLSVGIGPSAHDAPAAPNGSDCSDGYDGYDGIIL